MAETPSNLMTPTIFSNKIQEIFQNFSKVQVIIRDKQWIEEKKMGCFLGVTKGSNEPPKFIEVHYNGTTGKYNYFLHSIFFKKIQINHHLFLLEKELLLIQVIFSFYLFTLNIY